MEDFETFASKNIELPDNEFINAGLAEVLSASEEVRHRLQQGTMLPKDADEVIALLKTLKDSITNPDNLSSIKKEVKRVNKVRNSGQSRTEVIFSLPLPKVHRLTGDSGSLNPVATIAESLERSLYYEEIPVDSSQISQEHAT